MDEVRWAIAGPGRIAAKAAPDFALVDGARLVAVGSRSQQRADAFAAEHGVPRAHGSYAALVADEEVDAIYVATPHTEHVAFALAAIAAGKALLVEKAFTATARGAEEVVAAARAAGVFVMEAMWTRFAPAMVRLREEVAAGTIGDLVSVQADLGVIRPYDPADRIFAAQLGGGAMLDLGVYPVSLAQGLLGEPEVVVARGTREPNGVDAEASLLLGYPGGRTALLSVSQHSPLPGAARVFGRDGSLELPPRFHHPEALLVRRGDSDEAQRIELPLTGGGYAHEIAEATACILAGRTESAVMPLDDTLSVMRTVDQALGQLGVSYPAGR